MIFQPRFDADAVVAALAARDIADGRADLLHAPARPSRSLTREACAHMRLFVSGSAPLLAETHERLARKDRPSRFSSATA